jgi:hypothetical protein
MMARPPVLNEHLGNVADKHDENEYYAIMYWGHESPFSVEFGNRLIIAKSSRNESVKVAGTAVQKGVMPNERKRPPSSSLPRGGGGGKAQS